ncbi:MAG: hypothetical protein ACE5M4_03340 [Anaerolineales bacterium]
MGSAKPRQLFTETPKALGQQKVAQVVERESHFIAIYADLTGQIEPAHIVGQDIKA